MRTISVLLMVSLLLSMNTWSNHTCKTCLVCSIKSKKITKTCCGNSVQEKSCCSNSKSAEKSKQNKNCNCCSLAVAPLQEKKAIIDKSSVSKSLFDSNVSHQINDHFNRYTLLKLIINKFTQCVFIRYIPLTIPLLI